MLSPLHAAPSAAVSPLASDVVKANRLLSSAEKPVIISGGGVILPKRGKN